jgi:hypothetical protein
MSEFNLDWGAVKSNKFWGRRGGSQGVVVAGVRSDFAFKIKRGGVGKGSNSGPSGHKLRWYQGRVKPDKAPARKG